MPCCVCSSKSPKVSLHSFPKNKELSDLWKERCDIRPFDDASRFYVCSRHFTRDDYVEPNAKKFGNYLKLKPNRVPSLRIPNPIILPVTPATPKPATPTIQPGNPIILPVHPTIPEPATPAIKPVNVPIQIIIAIPSASSEPAVPTPSMPKERLLNLKPNPDPKVDYPNPVIVAVPPASPDPADPLMQIETVWVKSEPHFTTENVTNPVNVDVPSASLEPAVPTMETDASTPKKRKFAEPRYAGEITFSDFETPRGARIAWRLAKKHIMKQAKKLNSLEAKNYRLKKKVDSLQSKDQENQRLKKKVFSLQCKLKCLKQKYSLSDKDIMIVPSPKKTSGTFMKNPTCKNSKKST